MKTKLSLLLYWLGIHRYKVTDISSGFGVGGEQFNVKFVELRKFEKNRFFIRLLLVYQQFCAKR